MNLSLLRVCFSVALAVALPGCATEPLPSGLSPVVAAAVGAPASKTVELTIYRPGKFVGGGLRPTVRVNGQDLVRISNGKVFRTRLAPGHYLFDVDGHKSGAELDAKGGEAYYFLVTIEQGLFVGNGALTLVAPQQGAYESRSLKPVDRDNIEIPSLR